MRRDTLAWLLLALVAVSVVLAGCSKKENSPPVIDLGESKAGTPSQQPEAPPAKLKTIELFGSEFVEQRGFALSPVYFPTVYKEKGKDNYVIVLEFSKERLVFPFYPELNESMAWISRNIPADRKFMSWWEFAGQIMGQTGREVVFYAPSKELVDAEAGYASRWNSSELSDSELARDVARAYSATDSIVTYNIMDEQDADYILISDRFSPLRDDVLSAAGEDASEFFNNGEYTQKGKHSVFYRMLRGIKIGNFVKIYDDDHMKIYKRILPRAGVKMIAPKAPGA